MTERTSVTGWRSPRAVAVAAALSIALAYSVQSSEILGSLLRGGAFQAVPYLRAAVVSLGDIVAIVVLAAFAAGRSPVTIAGLAGVDKPVLPALAWAGLVFAPALAASLALTTLSSEASTVDHAWLSVGGPFIEEFCFRGLAIGILMRLCGWHWLPACLWPAVFFGAAHLWQGSDLGSLVGVVAVTGIGGLLFGWLFVRWGYNLWPPFLLHAGLNGLWTAFDLGENALGGWLGNGLRLAVIAIAIAATFWLAPRPARA